MPSSKTERDVRSFLGNLNYILRFISNLTAKAEPIFRLFKKNNTAKWDQACQEAFRRIKQYLSNPPVLVPPVMGRPLILYMAVQQSSMGCFLGQYDDTGRKERAIYYLSKKFNDYESNICCALAWTANQLKHYMLNHKTWLIRMDPIKYVFESLFITERLAKWQVILSQYDIVYMTRKSVKGSVIADLLAENPINDYEALDFEFPDEYINADKNQFANALATLAVMTQMEEGQIKQLLQIKARSESAYYFMIEEETDGKPWYHVVQVYIKNMEFPPGASRNERRMIRRLAMGYFPSGEILYKRSSNDELLRCVNAKEAKRILFETHEGIVLLIATGI
ncbi:hypothetical protein GH714_032554 [Hevea brasiliensis]|uniref:Reverse transcriptase/retrotransposon-derived protein RNase H-like domain-containing protein n=1 Tax=Hevea brasiliensis TaxID=3981 RepID=A0A6A6N951_HEVBR|nr:hypothetical protein GH714_032554 [Hevea brasiliensis]